jgi:protein ImuB
MIEPGQVLKIASGKEELFLKHLPLDLLPGSEEILRRFHLLGLNTMGQLATLPLKAIDSEFGREGRLLWQLAKGIDPTPLQRWSPRQVLEESHSFETPSESSREILEYAEPLLERLESNLKRRGQCSRNLEASLFLANSSVIRKVFHFKNPASSKEVLLNRLTHWLGEATFDNPVAEIRFTLSPLPSPEGEQLGLLDTRLRSKAGVSPTLESLQQRFGKAVIKRAILSDSTYGLPEESSHFIEFR